MFSVYRDSSTAQQAGISALQKRLADSDMQLNQVRLTLEQVGGVLQQHLRTSVFQIRCVNPEATVAIVMAKAVDVLTPCMHSSQPTSILAYIRLFTDGHIIP